MIISSRGGVDVAVVVLVFDGGDASFSICLKFSQETNKEKKVKGSLFSFTSFLFFMGRAELNLGKLFLG